MSGILRPYHTSANTTFGQELMTYRIEEACWLATYTNEGTDIVSEKLGYQDTNSFTRIFKREVGLTFKSYRERRRHNTPTK